MQIHSSAKGSPVTPFQLNLSHYLKLKELTLSNQLKQGIKRWLKLRSSIFPPMVQATWQWYESEPKLTGDLKIGEDPFSNRSDEKIKSSSIRNQPLGD